MNKVELIAAVAEKAELSKKDAEKAVAAFLESVEEAVASGDKVQVSVPLKSAPARREPAAIPARRRPSPFLLPSSLSSRPARLSRTLSRNKHVLKMESRSERSGFLSSSENGMGTLIKSPFAKG